MTAYAYCTQTDLETKFSSYGVTAFSDHDDTGSTNETVVDNCIDEASSEVDMYCSRFYTSAILAESRWINHACVTIALKLLCECRGNPVPDSLMNRYTEIIAKLERLRDGLDQLPDSALRSDLRPGFSNISIDRRYRFSRARVNKTSSTQRESTLPIKSAESGMVGYE